ncbi:MAG: CPBP family intramembrane metalloprotease [Treponema sp.]|nr:CPBP family intramembrane metalloprotease [Candidatus Treponema equifaecale]
MSKRVFLAFAFFTVLNAISFSEENLNQKSLSHAQVAATAFVPYGITLAGIGTRFLFPENLRGYSMTAFSTVANIPSCIIDPFYSIPMTAAGSGMMLSSNIWVNDFGEYSFGRKNLSSIGHFGMDMNMYTAYHGYAVARKMGPSELYQNKENYSFSELMLSPFNPGVLKEAYVCAPILGYAAVLLLSNSMNGFENSIFNSGHGYFGDRKVNALAGFFGLLAYSLVDFTITGVGEESFFRGTGYEEMQVSFGLLPAKIMDCVCFAGAHVPQDIFYENENAGEVVSGFASRALMGLILQAVYDKCGLRASTAVHMWVDTLITMFQYMYSCGVENDYKFSIDFKIKL